MRLLITAFEPFGERSCNTSADLLKALKKTGGSRAFSAYSYKILPVNFYQAWPRLNAAIRVHHPHGVILMGEKAGGRITLECAAHNRRRSRNGIVAIHKKAPKKIISPLSLPRMHNITISQNAGDYLCNFIYFKILRHKPTLPCVFLHIPALDQKKWRACQKSYTSRLQNVIMQVAKAIDGTNGNVSTRENKKGAYHG